jgi:phage I-like protein
MPDCLFIADAPDTLTLASGTATSRVQIAKTGNFVDPRYGKFSITTADFRKWMDNFATLSTAQDRAGLPVDVDHGPEKRGDTEAAGWITKLDTLGKDGKTSSPNELWATVEWNSLGQELVTDKRYLYLSPSYQHNYKDENGRAHGTALVGVGLTNRPFLTMATVSLSKSAQFATEDVTPPAPARESDSSTSMPELSNTILTKLGLDDKADEAAVLAAIDGLSTNPTLDDLAKSQNKVVLDASDVTTLLADATAGRQAADELHKQKFETAFDKALSQGKATPAQKETYEKLYAADADTTLSALDSAPVVLNMHGVGGSGSDTLAHDAGGTLSAEADGLAVDEDRSALHEKALQLAAERNIDYADAVILAASGA